MKNTLLTVAVLAPWTLFAQQPAEPKDLASLRTSWTKARQQAVTPIDQKYIDALGALKLKYTRAGQLQEALAVDAEIKLMSSLKSSVGPKSPTSPTSTDKTLARPLLCGSGWTYYIPQEGRSWNYEFSQDRKVVVDKVLFGNWALTSKVLRVESTDGRLWMEFSLDLKTNGQGKPYLEEIAASKGTRQAVTLTLQ